MSDPRRGNYIGERGLRGRNEGSEGRGEEEVRGMKAKGEGRREREGKQGKSLVCT